MVGGERFAKIFKDDCLENSDFEKLIFMSNTNQFFGKDQAKNYDDQWSKLSPVNDLLHFLSKIIFKDLQPDAHILCVGAGTGAELIALAREFPEWNFTALDTSPEMIEVCRKNVEANGISDRCKFHVGTIDSLPIEEKFDAATSILVSQFLTEKEDRINFFREIRKRLNHGAYLINADLTSPDKQVSYDKLLEFWTKMLMFAGISQEKAEAATSQWKKLVAVSKQEEIEEIILSGGFENPTVFYQSLFIKACFATVPLQN